MEQSHLDTQCDKQFVHKREHSTDCRPQVLKVWQGSWTLFWFSLDRYSVLLFRGLGV